MKSMNLFIQSWKKPAWRGLLQSKKTRITLLVLLLIVVAGIAGYQVLLKPNSAVATPAQIQTVVARTGELVIFASGAGQVIPATEISIGFDESGTLSEILVSVGEKVQAGQTLAQLQTERTEEEVALAVAQTELDVLTAQQALDEIYETAQMDAAEALKAVEDAQKALSDLNNSQLAQAQALQAVAEADEALKTAYSAYNGTILSIDASVGESVGTGAIITLADLSRPVLTVYLDETDIGIVEVGYEAEVVFDSLPDSTFSGRVISVDPSLQTVSNIDTIVAQVKLDVDPSSQPFSLPMGSNASVDVIGGRVENAVLIPVEALRDLGDGEYAVFVMQNGESRLRVVTVGLLDYTTAAITDGLEAGEVVTTGVVETSGSESRQSNSTNRATGEMRAPTGDMMVPPP